jgi:hypothetical protein
MSLSTAHSARVFSAGGHCFTWVEVVEWVRARGEWAALQKRVATLPRVSANCPHRCAAHRGGGASCRRQLPRPAPRVDR